MANASTDPIVLEVESRTETGGSACRRIRRSGAIPGNVYGLDKPAFKVLVNPKRLDDVLRLGSGVNTVFRLSLAGENTTREAMIKELQRDPVSELPLHVDFIRVDPLKKVQISVPVRLVGTPEGVRNEGGIVDFVNRVVEIECLPSQIPEHLDVDVSALHINQNVTVADLALLPEGAEILDPPDQILAVVSAPRVEEEAPTEEPVEAEEEEGEGAKKADDADATPPAEKSEG